MKEKRKGDWFHKRLVLAFMQSVTADAQTKPYQEVLLSSTATLALSLWGLLMEVFTTHTE